MNKNKCPLCTLDKVELLYTNSRGNKYLENYVCDNCGFVYTYPRLSNDEVTNLYVDGKFSEEARKSAEPNFNKFVQTEKIALERIHFLEKTLPTFFSASRKCLEIGVGTGSFSWLIKSRGHVVSGLEPDFIFTNIVKKRYNVEIINFFFEKL